MQESDAHTAVSNFFAQTIATAQHRIAASAEINKHTGRDFSSLACVNLNENLMSWILAGLLNPMGNHGQGDIFLKLFVRIVLGNENLDCSYVMVRCEAATHHLENNLRRIDILLTGPDWVCAIENKPRACEQKDQLEDYAKHLQKMNKAHTFLVFLARRDYKLISLHTENYKKYLRLWSFNDHPLKQEEQESPNEYPATSFFSWTLACKQHCEAAKVRYFIEDFENTVHTFVW